jgi:hypothetical protein
MPVSRAPHLTAASLLILCVACSEPEQSIAAPSGATSSGSAGGGGNSTSASTGGSSSSGGSGSGGGGAGVPSGVPMFVAHGHMGRTTISCDAGNSWVANQSNDDNAICWEPPNTQPDCDHDPGAGRGIGYGDGWFIATYGWGSPGGLRRSQDGVSWEEVLTGTTFGGVAHNPNTGVWLAAASRPQRSIDQGSSWTELEPSGISKSIRRFGFADHDGGRFVMITSDSNGVEIAVSADDGDSWAMPNPPGCGNGVQTRGGIAYGNGIMLVLGSDGIACSSTDGGDNWTNADLNASIESQLVWSGTDFRAWSADAMYASSDGVSWTSTPTVPNLRIGPVAASNDGVFVGVRGGWQVWYDQQEFYRSDDGINWQLLDSNSFVGSHPIRSIAFGYGSPSSSCP